MNLLEKTLDYMEREAYSGAWKIRRGIKKSPSFPMNSIARNSVRYDGGESGIRTNLMQPTAVSKVLVKGKIDFEFVKKFVFDQCEAVQTKAPKPTYFLHSNSLGKNIETVEKSITHGFFKDGLSNSNATQAQINKAVIVFDMKNDVKMDYSVCCLLGK